MSHRAVVDCRIGVVFNCLCGCVVEMGRCIDFVCFGLEFYKN